MSSSCVTDVKSAKKRAKKADLIILSNKIKGTRCGNCLRGDALVMTPKGSKRIDQIVAGDEVVGYDDGILIATEVIATGLREVDSSELVTLILEPNRHRKVIATIDHPFFEAKKGWIPIGELGVGNELFFIPQNQVHSYHRKVDNPMFNKDVVLKGVQSRFEKYGSGKSPKWRMSDNARQKLSQLMQTNNPSRDPEIHKRSVSKHDYHKIGQTSWTKRQDRKGPSNPEKRVLALIEKYVLPVRYTGNGAFWHVHKNPDFKVNGQKKVIEVWMRGWSWPGKFRDDQWATEKKRAWEIDGFECLMLEINDKKSDVEILTEIQNFVSNGLLIRKIIRHKAGKAVKVFNIQTGTENYFVKCTPQTPYVLTHNCEYYEKGFCRNKHLLMPVKPRWCCIWWNAAGIKRVHETNELSKQSSCKR